MKVELIPLPHTSDFRVTAEITDCENSTLLVTLIGDLSRVSLDGSHHEELWRHTCFELFIRDEDGEGYQEFNCSPDGRFTRTYLSSYRTIQNEIDFPSTPVLISKTEQERCEFEIRFPGIMTDQMEVAVAVITADNEGVRRFWGIKHRGDIPDFHHDDNFFRLGTN